MTLVHQGYLIVYVQKVIHYIRLDKTFWSVVEIKAPLLVVMPLKKNFYLRLPKELHDSGPRDRVKCFSCETCQKHWMTAEVMLASMRV